MAGKSISDTEKEWQNNRKGRGQARLTRLHCLDFGRGIREAKTRVGIPIMTVEIELHRHNVTCSAFGRNMVIDSDLSRVFLIEGPAIPVSAHSPTSPRINFILSFVQMAMSQTRTILATNRAPTDKSVTSSES